MLTLTWKSEVGIGDIFVGFTFLAAAVGLILTAIQLRHGILVQRAQFLLDATKRYFADTHVRRLYYDVDYERFHITFLNGEPNTVQRAGQPAKPFVGSDEERWLDSLLYTFDVIGRIVELGALSASEVSIFAFQAARVFRNTDIANLLRWLDKERDRFGGEVPAHRAARKLVEGVPLGEG
jgi:hypothetical protein